MTKGKKKSVRKWQWGVLSSIYVPTLTYGQDLWPVTERIRLQIPAAEMSALCRVLRVTLRDRVRSLELCHTERSQLRLFGPLFRISPGFLPGEVFQAQGRPRMHWRDYTLSHLATVGLWVPLEEPRNMARERNIWTTLFSLLPPWPRSKWMGRWMDGQMYEKKKKDGQNLVKKCDFICVNSFSVVVVLFLLEWRLCWVPLLTEPK